jgi:polyphenol oxidase
VEPFQYKEISGTPCFVIYPWKQEFAHLTVGFSARKKEDHLNYNYALNVGDQPNQVISNREQLARNLGMPVSSWTSGEQVHGTRIAFVLKQERGKGFTSLKSAFPRTDGMVTKESDILLTTYYADCVPLYFYSPDIEIIGIAHAGWRGTVGEIGNKVVSMLVKQGADLKKILVAIGPSIGSCCYEVDEQVVHPLMSLLPKNRWQKIFFSLNNGKWKLDLKEVNKELLIQIGILPMHIVISKWCTSCHDNYFYSHRRDVGMTGRMVAWIGRKKKGNMNG